MLIKRKSDKNLNYPKEDEESKKSEIEKEKNDLEEEEGEAFYH